MKNLHLFLALLCTCILQSACAQSAKPMVAPEYRLIDVCEGCEAVFESGHDDLSSVDTLPGFSESGKKIRVSGTVYQPDGVTPAPDVILYVYQTNQEGIYENKYGATNWERRHGYIRGWLKTDQEGRYRFYTLQPAIYPSRTEAAHIHLTILEPDGKYYYLDSYFFADDPLLSEKMKNPSHPRGGSDGILELVMEDGIWSGTRDIILGKNIPEYE